MASKEAHDLVREIAEISKTQPDWEILAARLVDAQIGKRATELERRRTVAAELQANAMWLLFMSAALVAKRAGYLTQDDMEKIQKSIHKP